MSENIIEKIRGMFYKPSIVIHDDALGELERKLAIAIQERDEARRELCDFKGTTRWYPYFPPMTAHRYAAERGWDCYEANTNNQLFREGRL